MQYRFGTLSTLYLCNLTEYVIDVSMSKVQRAAIFLLAKSDVRADMKRY